MTTSYSPPIAGLTLSWNPATWLCARVALVCAYLIGGLTKPLDFPRAVAEQAHFGLHPPQVWAAFAIIVEIGGSWLIIWGRFVWFAGGTLGVLTAIASLVARELLDYARPCKICRHERPS
jgi:uncharacterized membrane protein YphA (DoxX/SURF4 family)